MLVKVIIYNSVCQKTVYQMKFHQVADCQGENMCRGFCEKIREQWGSGFNPFEAFVKDVFGKCEICFRAGYCTISQCKEQEQKERQIIDHIVNSATLTAKINNQMIVNFPTANPADVTRVHEINTGIQKELGKDIKNALVIGTTEQVVPKINNLFNNYLINAFSLANSGYKVILDYNADQSAANIPMYNGTSAEQLVSRTEQSIKKLDGAVNKLTEIEKLADKGEVKIAKKEAGTLEKSIDGLEKKFTNAEKKLDNQIDTLNKMATAVKDPNVLSTIQSTLQNVKTAEKAAHEAKEAIKEDKKQFRRLKK
jgi:soluble cytochrome b562